MPEKVVIEHNDNVMIVEHATRPMIVSEFPDGAMLFRLFSPAGLWTMLVAPEALPQLVDMAQTVMAHAAAEKLRKSVEDRKSTIRAQSKGGKSLAAQFGVDYSVIKKIRTHKLWRHVA